MTKVSVSTVVSSATLSPLARVLRTTLQIIIGYGASFPVLIGWFHLTATTTAKIGAIVSGIVFVATTLQNVLEHFNVIPTVGAKAVPKA